MSDGDNDGGRGMARVLVVASGVGLLEHRDFA